MRVFSYDNITIAKVRIAENLVGVNPAELFLYTNRGRNTTPRRLKRPCSYPGCPNLTEGRFCPEHEKKGTRRYEKYDGDPTTKRRYGRVWKRIRGSYAAAHPLCEMCLGNGVYTPTEQIRHVKPLSRGGTRDRESLMAPCKSCHVKIHVERGDRWHNL